jgi:hypothetical protein
MAEDAIPLSNAQGKTAPYDENSVNQDQRLNAKRQEFLAAWSDACPHLLASDVCEEAWALENAMHQLWQLRHEEPSAQGVLPL